MMIGQNLFLWTEFSMKGTVSMERLLGDELLFAMFKI